MNGVVQSSSQNGSSVSEGTTRSFDVSQESEVLKLLQFVRRGPFDAEVKSAMRDTILDFSTTHDFSILEAIAPALTEKGVELHNGSQSPSLTSGPTETAAVADASTPPASGGARHTLGSTRPLPSFAAGAAVAPESPTPTDTPVAPATPVVSAIPATEVPESTPAPEPTPAASSEPAAAPVEEDTGVSYGDPLERIKEIKKSVNEKVGNPVNLIDANNTIGREYMNALLHAMKVINGGSSEEVNLGMQRLEKAFAAVESSIASGETVIAAPETPQPVQQTQPTPTTPEPTTPTPEAVAAPVPDSDSAIPDVTPPTPEPPQPTPPTPDVHAPDPAPVTSEVMPATPPAATVDPAPPAPAAATTPAAVTTPEAQPPVPPGSLAAQVRARDSELAQITAANAPEPTPADTDPLMSPEVTAGLHQLLSEWKLFKAGGIFGTGPSGYEHQLYTTLSTLPMATVISGRFEGVTPEIRQSISDYMNGWHYEQGIVHEMSETFEHYLRRVIQEILKKTASSQTAQPQA